MGRGSRAFKTATLVDCHVHQHRPGLEKFELGASNHLGRGRAGHQNRADDEIGIGQVMIDASGNVWMANNWLRDIDLENPGGHELVVFLGLAAPIKTPLIGPPERP